MIFFTINQNSFSSNAGKMLDKNKLYCSFKPRINHIERINKHISEAFSRLNESRHNEKVF